MSRLTKKFDDGYGSADCYNSCLDCYGNECDSVTLMVNKLAHYEDLEEQGRLIELPCKIGDYVYKIHNNDWKTYFRGEGKELGIIKSVFTYKDIPGIGTLVFLTKEEAEAKLAEMECAE